MLAEILIELVVFVLLTMDVLAVLCLGAFTPMMIHIGLELHAANAHPGAAL